MSRSFDAFQQLAHIVHPDSRSESPKTPGRDTKRLAPLGSRGQQSAAQRLVDDLAKGAAGPARGGLQFGRDVVVKRQGGSHIMMLVCRHHDVKRSPPSHRGGLRSRPQDL